MYNIKLKERMQKVFLVLFVGVLGVFISRQTQDAPIVNDVVLENVEALASTEGGLPIYCEDSGSYSCPLNGDKFGFVYIGYSLEPDEETY